MSYQIADEPAGGLELLSRLRRRWREQVVAQNVAVSPFVFVAGQPQAFQPAAHCWIHRGTLTNALRHGCNLVRGDWKSIGRLIDRAELQSGWNDNSSNRHEGLTCRPQ
jgi:hypothetical protein